MYQFLGLASFTKSGQAEFEALGLEMSSALAARNGKVTKRQVESLTECVQVLLVIQSSPLPDKYQSLLHSFIPLPSDLL